MPVEIAVQLPDDVAAKLREQNPDLSRVSLEKLVCSLYRDGRLSEAEAMRALASSSRLAFGQLLARHNLQREWSQEEIAREFGALDGLPEGR